MIRIYFISFVLVFLVDWLLIMATGQLTGHKNHWFRIVIGAMIGCVHAWICLKPGFSFLGNGFWRLIFLAVAGCIAFDFRWMQIGIFTVLNLALGGIVTSLCSGGALETVLSLVVIAVLGWLGMKGGHKFVKVCVPTEQGKVCFHAFRDSGNFLRDPLSGGMVLVASADIGCKLLQLDRDALANPVNTMLKKPGMRLIPYSSVGGKGFMLAKKFDKVMIDNHSADVVIAFSSVDIGKGKGFEALTGGAI